MLNLLLKRGIAANVTMIIHKVNYSVGIMHVVDAK